MAQYRRLLHGQVAAADGALLWEKRYNGPANSDDQASCGGGGRQRQRGGDGVFLQSERPDYYTAKYAAADGALLWEKRYNGPANARCPCGGGGRQRQRGGDGVFRTGATTTRPSMRRRTARCSGRNATTARRTATTKPRRWRWTAAATWW